MVQKKSLVQSCQMIMGLRDVDCHFVLYSIDFYGRSQKFAHDLPLVRVYYIRHAYFLYFYISLIIYYFY
jgi:hypothetical protein